MSDPTAKYKAVTVEFANELTAERDRAYRERAQLVALLAALYPSHIGHSDPHEPDWAVVIIESPAGQLSWHVAPGDMDLFAHVQPTSRIFRGWDGHSTDEKYERVRALAAAAAAAPRPSWPDHETTEWAVHFNGGTGLVYSATCEQPSEDVARRIAAEDPKNRTVRHRRVIRRRDSFGPWIEDGPETSALPMRWVNPSEPDAESIAEIKARILALAEPDTSPGQ